MTNYLLMNHLMVHLVKLVHHHVYGSDVNDVDYDVNYVDAVNDVLMISGIFYALLNYYNIFIF